MLDGGMRILLASRSPRRSQLLRAAGFDFESIAPGPEPVHSEAAAEIQCVDSAQKKALGADIEGRTGILLAVDTVISLDGSALGKARDREEASVFLDLLSGREHDVLTAHAHARVSGGDLGAVEVLVARSHVVFRELSPEVRKAYLDEEDWRDKAGAYGIQSAASAFARLVGGDLDTVIGLSLRVVREILAAHA
jgi:nucleoside triphosphate pyrophosphatase